MQSVVEEISQTKKRLTIEATSEEVEAEIRKALNDVRMKTKIPGFRPGKAPISLIEKKYGKDVEKDVMGRIVPEYYVSAVRDNKLKPISHPTFEQQEFERSTGVKMVCTFDVRPDVDGLEYDGIPVKAVEVAVEDNEVELQIKRLLMSKSVYEPMDRPVQLEDLVVAGFEAIPDSESEKYSNQFIKVGGGNYPEELSDALVGKNKGDNFEINLTFGEKVQDEALKGKKLDLKVTVNDIKTLVEPQLDDEFAKDLGHDSLDKLRENIRESLHGIKNANATKEQQGQVIRHLVDKYEFPLPESVLETEINTIIKEARTQDKFKEKTDAELRERFKGDAERSVKTMVILDIIGEKEDVKVSDEEVKSRLSEIARSLSMSEEAIMQYYSANESSLETVKYNIFREKVADLIYKKAQIEKSVENNNEKEG